MHKVADGIPKLPRHEDWNPCDICLMAKMRKLAAGKGQAKPTAHGQHLATDVGFVVQKSKNAERFKRLVGFDGSTCYYIVFDVFSEKTHGITLPGKAFPEKWFDLLLSRIKPPNELDRTVRMDKGGEMANNHQVQQVFAKHGHVIQPMAADASQQNPNAERPHRTVGEAIRAALHGRPSTIRMAICILPLSTST